MERTLSVIVPGYNEEKNIASAIESVVRAVSDIVDDYEIIVVDDGSTDSTAAVARTFADKDPRVRVVRNETNRGYGFSYRRGLAAAVMNYVTSFCGDNDMSGDSLRELVKAMGRAQVITCYYLPGQRRPWLRSILSRAYSGLINVLFGLKLRYPNGTVTCELALVRSLDLKCDGMAVHSECLVKLLKKGCSYEEIGFDHVGRRHGHSRALTVRNLVQTFRVICFLFREVYFEKRET